MTTKTLLRQIQLIGLAVICCFAGQPAPARTTMTTTLHSGEDPHSFANISEVVVTHLDLDLDVDFASKRLTGKASLRINNKTGARRLYLDTRDLTIHRVTIGNSESPATYSLGDPVAHLGRSLMINITPEADRVNVYYTTSPEAAALQWLEPSQTAGGKRPFLFTQSQAILARTWVPCQDSPGVRMTYNARVKVPPDLMAVMSASNGTKKNADGLYQFQMLQPVPSYLLALAVGDIEFRAVGKRSGVYAEPPLIKKAAWELADMERMIAAAESLYGPYRWERYDVIVLPPSFPFGGMENPRLTFATSTILAGDRSLVALIAHELAHSWSGNLVTNATWNDFWLNEGFTTYFERRIMEVVYGKSYAEMLAQLGYQDLQRAIAELGPTHPDTRLRLDLAGRDPDEGMTEIPYEKGALFLRWLEETIGRTRWDAFLRSYFDAFAFQSMTTDGFLAYLRQHLLHHDPALEARLQVDRWIDRPGLPSGAPQPRSKEFDKVEAQVKLWQSGKPARTLKTTGWTTHHWLHFLKMLPEAMTRQQMADLDRAFKFTQSGNSEILFAWLMHAVVNRYEPAYPALEKFLTGMGRRKFLRPLYAELAKTPHGAEMARRIYERARPSYHAVSRQTIDAILKWGN